MAEKNKDVYLLDLHESTHITQKGPEFLVTRVPSGWIYSFSNGDSVFVPFDNKFQSAKD